MEQYQQEMEVWKANNVRPKPSRYVGNRFISIDEHFENQYETRDNESSKLEFDDIVPILIERGINERDVQIIKLRTEGYDYKEISEMVGGEVNALTQRYKRAMEKLNINTN